jgi:hypothetical protein
MLWFECVPPKMSMRLKLNPQIHTLTVFRCGAFWKQLGLDEITREGSHNGSVSLLWLWQNTWVMNLWGGKVCLAHGFSGCLALCSPPLPSRSVWPWTENVETVKTFLSVNCLR